jgi:hypothetical protein
MSRAAWFLFIVGLLQMTGDLLGMTPLRGIGAATTASPAPKVFSAVRRFETYSTRFFLEWTDTVGVEHSLEVTPKVYARLHGPYNRRNAYGAVVAYGPVLPPGLRDPITRHALTGNAPLLRELGIDPADVVGPVRIRYEPRSGTDMGDLPRMLEVQ